MNTTLSVIPFAVTILWGATVALLGVLDSPALTVVAAVGGPLVGLMWVVVAVARKSRGREQQTEHG